MITVVQIFSVIIVAAVVSAAGWGIYTAEKDYRASYKRLEYYDAEIDLMIKEMRDARHRRVHVK